MKLQVRFLAPHKPEIVVGACNSSTWEMGAGGSEVQYQPERHKIVSQYIKLYRALVILGVDKECLLCNSLHFLYA